MYNLYSEKLENINKLIKYLEDNEQKYEELRKSTLCFFSTEKIEILDTFSRIQDSLDEYAKLLEGSEIRKKLKEQESDIGATLLISDKGYPSVRLRPNPDSSLVEIYVTQDLFENKKDIWDFFHVSLECYSRYLLDQPYIHEKLTAKRIVATYYRFYAK